ncbi:hypothetical protein CERZMDRAFT_102658 [Cercospora zeae-maydis SCOH1-5]|uniref:Uncharacterized protein n=1 Tax=Cercospora zeae-maydis SCOH1-5 TaxID=717836 RepID=A0A6A6F155_9PEZI|nr:hypothetical protein CERZMDRAFT_102658 [Cercospora zeae-maydis SCOH1-5]
MPGRNPIKHNGIRNRRPQHFDRVRVENTPPLPLQDPSSTDSEHGNQAQSDQPESISPTSGPSREQQGSAAEARTPPFVALDRPEERISRAMRTMRVSDAVEVVLSMGLSVYAPRLSGSAGV